MTDQTYTVIDPIPDDNTSEAIVYGSQYKFAKSSKYFWDETEDVMDKEIVKLMRKIKDPEFALYVVRNRPDMIWANNPPVPEPDKIRDLWTLRQIIGWGTGKELLDVYRRENKLYAMMMGVSEYTSKLMEGEVSQSMWASATTGLIEPIDYESVRTVKDREEILSKRDAARYEARDSEEPDFREKEARRFNEDYARYLEEEHEDDLEEEEEESPEDAAEMLDIVREEVRAVGSDIEDHPIGTALGPILHSLWFTPMRALLKAPTPEPEMPADTIIAGVRAFIKEPEMTATHLVAGARALIKEPEMTASSIIAGARARVTRRARA